MRKIFVPLFVLLVLSPVSGVLGQACFIPRNISHGSPNQGDTVTVHLGFYLFDAWKVWDLNQQLSVDFVVVMRWEDARLSEDSLGYSLLGCSVPRVQVWNPELNILKADGLDVLWPDEIRIEGDGELVYAQRYSGEVGINLDLRDFPFDKHEVMISAISLGAISSPVKFVIEDGKVGQLPELNIPGWKIGTGHLVTRNFHVPGIDVSLPRMDFIFPIQRLWYFYLFKVFFPLSMIVFMAWSVFWISPELVMPQISLASISILTLVAFQLSLRTLLPEISYLTRIDYFLIGSTILVFAALIEALATTRIGARGKIEQAIRLDRIFRWAYVLLFVLLMWWVAA